jgi:arsenate reductase
MCTGNSCRSIIAEALINRHLEGVEALSCGTEPAGAVNPHARRVLEAHGEWDDRYRSKSLDAVIDEPFDLVVTVCDDAQRHCPVFPRPVRTVHVGFDDPAGQPYAAFEETRRAIMERLVPRIDAIRNGRTDP